MFKRILFLFSLGGILILPSLASAHSLSAFAGTPSSPSEAACWVHSNGAVTNTCSTTKRWCVALSVNNPGSFTVYVNAYGPSSSGNVGCFARSVNGDATHNSSSPQVYLSTFGSAQSLILPGAYVPSYGALFACCDIGPAGRMNTVVW